MKESMKNFVTDLFLGLVNSGESDPNDKSLYDRAMTMVTQKPVELLKKYVLSLVLDKLVPRVLREKIELISDVVNGVLSPMLDKFADDVKDNELAKKSATLVLVSLFNLIDELTEIAINISNKLSINMADVNQTKEDLNNTDDNVVGDYDTSLEDLDFGSDEVLR